MEASAMLQIDYMNPKLVQRFWSKVERSGAEDCWNWKANALKGRGLFKVGTKNEYAPRVSWVLSVGDIAEGECVLHTCDNPACVNPRHLFLGTKTENNLDRNNKDRQAKGSRSGRATITEDDVRLIRQMISDGATLRSIEALGYSYTSVVDIKRRKSWAWLT